jgi:excisionase family DNA binding protein
VNTLNETAANAEIPVSPKEQKEIFELYKKLREAEAKLVGPDGKTEILPPNVNSFLFRLLAELKASKSVTILQSKAQLTTVEASKLLGMSRQHLITLLDKGEIPFHMVGTHRRIYAREVLAFKVKRDSSRRKVLDDMAREEQEQGTYSKIPDDFNTGQ